MTTLSLMDWLLIVTGLLNVGASVFAAIVITRSKSVNKGMRRGKYLLVLAACLYTVLEFAFVVRGTYLIADWVPVLWNVMDACWMLGAAVYVQAVSMLIASSRTDCQRRKADQQLQATLEAVSKATPTQ
jgi:hypothetical protein